MIVREACIHDVEQIARLENHIFSDAWSAKSLSDSLKQAHVRIWVALGQIEEVIGYLIFYTAADEGDLARIAVSTDARRGGVAAQLMEAMWSYCKMQRYVRVLLEVRTSNIEAVSLYKKHGFQELGVRKDYYDNPREDGIIMEKGLDITSGI